MIKLIVLSVLAAAACSMMAAEATSSPLYEMRVYYAPEGKLDDLHARFRDHTLRLFEKHGIKNIGYWVPQGGNPENKLVYVLSYPDREARDMSWKAFMSDPDWKKAHSDSEKNGKRVAKIEQIFVKETDYSATLKVKKEGDRVFELRTYTTPEGKLDELDDRFRNHTMDLFKKHGMNNLIYWHKTPDQKGAETTLIYLLGHKSREAGQASFDAFRKDPDWLKAKGDSEKEGSLTVPNGVKSEILVLTDYSPLK